MTCEFPTFERRCCLSEVSCGVHTFRVGLCAAVATLTSLLLHWMAVEAVPATHSRASVRLDTLLLTLLLQSRWHSRNVTLCLASVCNCVSCGGHEFLGPHSFGGVVSVLGLGLGWGQVFRWARGFVTGVCACRTRF